jgi:hypothetical protein
MKFVFVTFVLGSLFVNSIGQEKTPQSSRDAEIKATELRAMGKDEASKRQERLYNEQKDNEQKDSLFSFSNPLARDSREPKTLSKPSFSKQQKKLISISKADLAKYSDFLKISKSGIFKVLPNICGNEKVFKVENSNCLDPNFIQLSYYSFRNKFYGNLDWTDLTYQNKEILVGFKEEIVGLIKEVENGEIDSLSIASEEAKSLLNFKMPRKPDELKVLKQKLKDGVRLGDFTFYNKIQIDLGKTYILRSHAYRTKEPAINDNRVDIVVCFKIVEIDENAGLTIIWREIHRSKSYKI